MSSTETSVQQKPEPGSTEIRYATKTKLERIAWLSRQDPQKEFACLMHHVNEVSLIQCYLELDGRKALG